MPAPPLAQQLGFPAADELKSYEIWDSYFTPALGSDGDRIVAEIERTLPTLEKGAIRRLCLFLHVGLGTTDPATDARIRANPKSILAPLRRWPDRLLCLVI